MKTLLRGEGIGVSFGGYAALADVSFSVQEGRVHALIGPNGAGKSTLFNVISGVQLPDRGKLSYSGLPCTTKPAHERNALGIARNFQQVRLMNSLSVAENVMVGCHAHVEASWVSDLASIFSSGGKEVQARRRSLEMLDFVGLGHRAQSDPDDLPLAEQRRVEIARAMAGNPRLLLLDEPAAGMNPTEVMDLAALIEQINVAGITVMLVEHHMKLVMRVAHSITVLDAGRKIAEGPVDVVRNDPIVISAYLGNDG